MVYLPDMIYKFRSELRIILSAAIFMAVMPLVAGFVMSHSVLPPIAQSIANLNSQVVRPAPIPPKSVIQPTTPSVMWPAKGVVTLEFGMPDPPYQRSHTGIDIAGKIGQPIVAFRAGKVIGVNYLSWGYGIYVEVDHGDNIVSIYGHLSAVTVSKGQDVSTGTMIGKEGRTGWATGPHVHFEVRASGIPVNPRTYVHGNPGL